MHKLSFRVRMRYLSDKLMAKGSIVLIGYLGMISAALILLVSFFV